MLKLRRYKIDYAVLGETHHKWWATRPILLILLCVLLVGGGCAKSDCGYKIVFDKMSINADCASSALFPDNDTCRVLFGIVEIIDFENGKYEIIDTIPVKSRSIFGYGLADVAFIDETYWPHITLKTYNRDRGNYNTLLSADKDSTNSWLFKAIICSVYLPDSIIAYHDEYPTIVRRIDSDGNCPILRTIPNAGMPAFSHDGSEVLLINYQDGCDSLNIGEIRCYNIAKDSLYTVLSSVGLKTHPQRLTSKSPLYYIKGSLESGESNIWLIDHNGREEQVTNFEWPLELTDFYLTDDYLYCFLEDHAIKPLDRHGLDSIVRKKIKVIK